MPRVRDMDKNSGKKYERFRIDVRIKEEKYEQLKRECQLLHITPSAKVRELIDEWIEKRTNNKNANTDDRWLLFIQKMKAEGFETPEEWIKARLGL